MSEFNTYHAAHILTQQSVLATCMRTRPVPTPPAKSALHSPKATIYTVPVPCAHPNQMKVAKTILHENCAASLLTQSIIVTFGSPRLAHSDNNVCRVCYNIIYACISRTVFQAALLPGISRYLPLPADARVYIHIDLVSGARAAERHCAPV